MGWQNMDEKENTRELVVVDAKRYKKVKQALAESEQRYRQLFENVPIGIYRTTPDGRVVNANPALIKMAGCASFAELASLNMNKEYSRSNLKRGDFIQLMERDGEVKGLEMTWRTRDGNEIHVRENSKLIRSENGDVFFEGTVEDISQNKLAEAAQKSRTQQLEIINQIISLGNSCDSLEELLDLLLDQVLKPQGFAMAAIFMYDADLKKMNVVAYRGVAKSFFRNNPYNDVENMPFSQLLQRGQPVFADHCRDVIPDLARKYKWRMAGSIPMLSKGLVVGAINVACCQREVFSQEEKNLLQLIGKEAGTLISKLQTEAALRKSEKYYRTLIDTSPDLITVMDLDARLITVNQQFLKLGGYFYDEVIGASAFDFVAGSDRVLLGEETAAFIKRGKQSGADYIFRKKNGLTLPLEVTASLLQDTSGRPMGIIAIGRDVSERKRDETQLRFLSSVTENTSDAIIVTDTDFQITYINKVAEEFFGYSLNELKGKTPQIFNAEPTAAMIQQALYQEIAAGNVHLGESLNRRKDGSMFYCEYKVMPLKDSQGKVYAYSSVQRDISERKKVEAKLLAYQEQLRGLTSEIMLVEERERRRIASELHDQIGQNLALCKLKIAALEKDPGCDACKDELAAVRRLLEGSIQDARSLIFDLSPPILYELGFSAALEWLAERLQEQFRIPVEFENRSRDLELQPDRQVILFQVVRELLMNVGKHSRASQAKIILSREHESLQIQVNDDGLGFDATEVFTPAKRQSGFGFFSVRERLKYFNGTIEVKSKPGQGTQIVLTLPLPAPPFGQRPPLPPSGSGRKAGKEKP